MIFITVGTEKWPFDRLLEIIDSAIGRKEIEGEVFAQIGFADYKPRFFPGERMLRFDKFAEKVRKADIVISHAGAGSTVLCLRLGKIPILFPRDESLGEHLDDHQMDLARKMDKAGKVLVAYSEEDLIYKVRHYKELISNLEPTGTIEGRDKLSGYLNSLIEK